MLKIDTATQPAHGQLVNTRTELIYIPDLNFLGTDSFTFAISDDFGGTATANASVKVTLPAPYQVSPSGLTTSLTPSYRWGRISDASLYSIAVFDLNTSTLVFNEAIAASSSICDPNYCQNTFPTSLINNASYGWYVTAYEPQGGWGPWSAGMAFLASVPPGQPTLLSPSGVFVANPQTLQPQYQWTSVSGAVLYYLVVFDLQTLGLQFTQVFDVNANPALCHGGVCTVTPDAPGSLLTNGKPYGAYVAALSYAGAGPWSPGVAFIDFVTPDAPTMTAPTGAQPAQPLYQWNAVQGATDYYVLVLDGSGGAAFGQWVNAAATCAGATCQFQQPTPLAPGNYAVFMASTNPAGTSGWGNALTFSVSAAPPAVTPEPAPTFKP
jgi:hypothetical protein